MKHALIDIGSNSMRLTMYEIEDGSFRLLFKEKIMTASQEIGEDGAAFFRNMLVNNLDGDYKQLLVAPNKL